MHFLVYVGWVASIIAGVVVDAYDFVTCPFVSVQDEPQDIVKVEQASVFEDRLHVSLEVKKDIIFSKKGLFLNRGVGVIYKIDDKDPVETFISGLQSFKTVSYIRSFRVANVSKISRIEVRAFADVPKVFQCKRYTDSKQTIVLDKKNNFKYQP